MSIEGVSCTGCKYAEPAIGDDDVPRLDCHRYPPVVAGWSPDGDVTEMYPMVGGDDWCGEFAGPEIT